LHESRQVIVEIHNIVKDINNLVLIIGKEFTSYSPLYNYPIQSSDMDIFIVSDLLPEFKMWPVENISAKCIVLPFNDKFVSMSLIQRDQQGLKLLAANDSKFFVRQCWHPLQVLNVKKFRLCYELVVLKHDTYKTTKNSIKSN
jgi:hypothetical protein